MWTTKVWILACLGGRVVQGWTWTMPHGFVRGGAAATITTWLPASAASSSDATMSSSSSAAAADEASDQQSTHDDNNNDNNNMFEDFVDFLVEKQSAIIAELEDREEGSATFSRDAWGVFDTDADSSSSSSSSSTTTTTTTTTAGISSGGITRVLQGGNIIEKGACSLTVIRQGTLTADRAATIRARQEDIHIQAGDEYAAAALSMVLHSKSPHVPTFRSDVRVFCVRSSSSSCSSSSDTNDEEDRDGNTPLQELAWFGGGADLTPYFLYDDDIVFFHQKYQDLCDAQGNPDTFSYPTMKRACDDYFYLPARSEHRGTGGIFFDDMVMNARSLSFVKGVTDAWMPSWLPIVAKRQGLPVTDRQRQWQLLRRGRYLEFNLLYDRGVKFGLANANPRVEGVMVSAPPLIAWEYNHQVEEGSEEERLLQILKQPIDWVSRLNE